MVISCMNKPASALMMLMLQDPTAFSKGKIIGSSQGNLPVFTRIGYLRGLRHYSSQLHSWHRLRTCSIARFFKYSDSEIHAIIADGYERDLEVRYPRTSVAGTQFALAYLIDSTGLSRTNQTLDRSRSHLNFTLPLEGKINPVKRISTYICCYSFHYVLH